VCDLKHMPTSIHGEEYLCTFTCLGTRFSESTYLKTRLASEFLECYKKYCKSLRNKTGNYPKYLHTDNGGEFVDKCTKSFNAKKGITHTTTSPHSSLQNPVAERINRTIGEGVLALLLCAYLPLSFWPYAATCFLFIKMRTPHKTLNLSTPIATWNAYNAQKSSIDLFDIRIFGCEAYVLDEKSLKAHPKAFRCIYLGPSNTQKGCNFYNLHTKKVICSRNFVLNEQCMPGKSYFPNIYDRYFGPTPPFDPSDFKTSTSYSPDAKYDEFKIPYSHLFEFNNNTDDTNDEEKKDESKNDQNYTESKSEMKSEVDEKNENEHNNSTISDDYVNIDPYSMYVFDRNIYSKVGEGDMPPLEAPTPSSNPSHPSTSVPSHSHTTTATTTTTTSTTPPPVSSTTSAPVDTVPVEQLHEWIGITGKRKTKFGKTLNNRWKHGGNEFDYEVEWANGEKTFEPESLASQYAADAIEEYNLKHHPDTSHHFEPPPNLPNDQPNSDDHTNTAQNSTTDTPSTNSISFANMCNFVHVHFFCYLAKLMPTSNTSWRNIVEPKNRFEMLKSAERLFWLAAERAELDSLLRQGTWKRVGKARKKPISCRWVYKLKPPTTLNPEPIFKARLVAHGYKQKEGVDYSSTFAQVATLKAFRLLLWLSVFLRFRATQLDVKNAFLHGKLDKEIYMSPPAGYEDEVGTVILIKSLYGIKQAPRIWYQTLVTSLHSLGFRELISDSCVFTHRDKVCYLLIFVDDIVCVTKDEQFRTHFENEMQRIFEIKILGDLRHFVGLQVDSDGAGGLHVHQHDYVQKLRDVFKNFFRPSASRVNSPCDSEVKFTRAQQPGDASTKAKMANYPYRSLIGSLLYLLGTRPEIYFIIITLSRFVQNPGFVHWLAALRVLYYICNTPLFGLIIKKGQALELKIYVDSDHAGDLDDRKSVSGYIIYLGDTPVVWRSKKQKGKPAESSCEAEYISLSAGINEVVWIIAFLRELGFLVPQPVPMFCDNTSANDLAYNPVHHDRTKHIDIRHHRIREFILDGTVEIFYVPSTDNPADIFTKSVSVGVFKRLICFVYGNFSSLVGKFST